MKTMGLEPAKIISCIASYILSLASTAITVTGPHDNRRISSIALRREIKVAVLQIF
jgi:hypothetical protein